MQLPNNDLGESQTSIYELPSPTDYGFDIDTGQYMPKLVSQPLAPPELLNDPICFCEDLFSDARVCMTYEQPSTQACNCTQANRIYENVFTVVFFQLLQLKINIQLANHE